MLNKKERLRLEQLKKEATDLNQRLDIICGEAESITNEYDSITFDFIYNDFIGTVDELVDVLERAKNNERKN